MGVLTTIHAAIAAIVGVVIGGAITSPVFGREMENWIPSGRALDSLPENEPTPVTLHIAREDGYREITAQHRIYLVKTSDAQVLALDTTCTHLGCPVHWESDEKVLKCPCHGGVYDRTGAVVSGPPPRSLARLTTRVEGGHILVQV